ncbi:phage baseplate protein [Saccharibacillus sacchari]|uniref:Phage baseplate protein n=1 Tax=Saccharibacillus sacchari TaxID=456493 RepID=A0ACC6PIE9_9BACL
MAKIDNFYVLVESENPSFENEVPSQPVEKGVNVSDHVQRKPRLLAISGFVAGPTSDKTLAFLKSASDRGKIVWFTGRTTMQGVITGFSTTHDSNVGNGFGFSLTIVEIQIATSTPAEKLDPPTRAQAAPIINSGVKKKKESKPKKAEKTKKDSKKKNGKKESKPKTKSQKKKDKAEKKTKEKETVKKVKFKAGSKWNK